MRRTSVDPGGRRLRRSRRARLASLVCAGLVVSAATGPVAAAKSTPSTVPAAALAAADYSSALLTKDEYSALSPFWGQTTAWTPPRSAPAGTPVPPICGESWAASTGGGAQNQAGWGANAGVGILPAVFGLPSAEDAAAGLGRVAKAVAACPNPTASGQLSVTPAAQPPRLGKTLAKSAVAFRGTATFNGVPLEYLQLAIGDGVAGAYVAIVNQTGTPIPDSEVAALAGAMHKKLHALSTTISKSTSTTKTKSGGGSTAKGPKLSALTDLALADVNASGVFGLPLGQDYTLKPDQGMVFTPCDTYSPPEFFYPQTGGVNFSADGANKLSVFHVDVGATEAEKVMASLGKQKPGCAYDDDTLESIEAVDVGDGGYRWVERYLTTVPPATSTSCLVRFGGRLDEAEVMVATAEYDAVKTKVSKLLAAAGCS